MPASSLRNILLASFGPLVVLAASGSGHSTRYWDCCKPSCAWPGKAAVNAPALTCDKNDNPLDPNTQSGCNGGSAFTCSNNSPWAVNDNLAYGFAATAINGGSESSWCCACYALTFTNGPVAGKTMVVQSTNTGGDLSNNHFDIQMPGGGVGIFDGCSAQYGVKLPGAQYGGISSRSECDTFPELLKDGCYWRFDWFKNADNPDFTFEQVQCPTALTDISGCVRNDDKSFPVFSGASGSSPAPKPITTVRAASSPAASSPAASSPAASSPAAFSRAASSRAASSPAASSPATIKTVASSKAACVPSPPAAQAAHAAGMWGQCGGIGWSGPTSCVAGATCKVQNPWYSQCLA